MASTPPATVCPQFHRASELIGRRWTGAIIFVLLKSRCRYAELRNAIPDITDRMLSERLQELEQEGLIVRTVVPATPVRVDYALTEKGRALAGPMQAIAEWAHTWGVGAPPAVAAGKADTASRARKPARRATPDEAARRRRP